MQRVRVLLVDDHALFREGLAGIISLQPDMEVVGEANDGLEAVVKAQELKPDLILMDVQMPGVDGLEALRRVKHSLPETTVVMLTVRDDSEYLFEAIKLGAQGYLLKNIHSREMLESMRSAMRGEAALPPVLAGRVLGEFRRLSQRVLEDVSQDESELTAREMDVLNLATTGAMDKEIAEQLSLSVYTVKTHMRNILAKLHVRSRQEATFVARRKGLT